MSITFADNFCADLKKGVGLMDFIDNVLGAGFICDDSGWTSSGIVLLVHSKENNE